MLPSHNFPQLVFVRPSSGFHLVTWERVIRATPPPPPPFPMLGAWATMLTSFMNEDRMSLMNFRRFATPDEPDCLLCRVYGGDGDFCHPSPNCPMLLDGYQCFKCLGPHPRSDCHNSIPLSPDNCPKCHLLHNGQALGNVPLHEGRYGVDCPSQMQAERYRILLWAVWRRNPSDMYRAMLELRNVAGDEELARWLGLKALGRSSTNFTRLVDACIRMLEQDGHKKTRF
jgi:hypothetical protein